MQEWELILCPIFQRSPSFGITFPCLLHRFLE